MRVVLTDGEELTCTNFKALDGGVLLTKDKKRKKVVGFVPNHQLRYVVDENVHVTPASPAESADPVDIDSNTGATSTASVGSDLQRLGGLGATYAERLHSAGYDSVAALAGADPVAVAEAAAVGPGRGRRWVAAAERLLAGSDDESGSGGGSDETENGDSDTEDVSDARSEE